MLFNKNKLLWNNATLEALFNRLKSHLNKLKIRLTEEMPLFEEHSLGNKILLHLLGTIETELKQLSTINIAQINNPKVPADRKKYRSFLHLENFLTVQLSDISLTFSNLKALLEHFLPSAKEIAKEARNISRKIYTESLTKSERLSFDRKLQLFCSNHETFLKLFFPYQGKAFFQYKAYIENPNRERTEINCHFEFMKATFAITQIGYDFSTIIEKNEELIRRIEYLSSALIDSLAKKANIEQLTIPPLTPKPGKNYKPSKLRFYTTSLNYEQRLYEKLNNLQETHPYLQESIKNTLDAIKEIERLHLGGANQKPGNLRISEIQKFAESYLYKIVEKTGDSGLLDKFYEFYISLMAQTQTNAETTEISIFEQFYRKIAEALDAGQMNYSLAYLLCSLMEISEEKFVDIINNTEIDTDNCIDALLEVSTAMEEISDENIQDQLSILFGELSGEVCKTFDRLKFPTAPIARPSPQ